MTVVISASINTFDQNINLLFKSIKKIIQQKNQIYNYLKNQTVKMSFNV